MLILHYAPDNASLIIRIALEELQLPYETRLVDRRVTAQKSTAYRALNPRGLIPVLETADGPIFETAAILLWSTDEAGARAPAPGAQGRGAFLSWLFALSNGPQTDLRGLTHPDQYAGDDPGARRAVAAAAQARIRETLAQLETLAGAGHAWFAGDTPSALDIYVCVLLRWFALYPPGGTDWFRLADSPRLAALAARIEARPAVRRAAAAEGLGPQPFSAPAPPDPPEGSAF